MSDYPESQTSTSQWWDRRAAEMDADIEAKRYPDRISALERKIGALYEDQTVMGVDHRAEIAAASAEIDSIRAAEQAERDAELTTEWTPDRTSARRTEWNAAVQAGTFTGRDGKVDWRLVREWESKTGWSHEDLGQAIKLNNL